jgi:riboflavin biosynthesis pyrimidine reductase
VTPEDEPIHSIDAVAPVGPGSPFELLFDDVGESGLPLNTTFQAIYPGSWDLPARDRPYVYVNFVLSRDGRVSFNEPGHSSGAEVSGFSAHDRWLMGLLRARADAVLMGDVTLQIEPDHVWSAEHIFPDDAEAFAGLRLAEGRKPLPLQVFLSLDGDIDVARAAIFARSDAHIVLATTDRGAARARSLPETAAQVDVLGLGAESVDIRALLETLGHLHGVRTVLCEGGPRAYGSVLAAGCIDDEFLTLSPVVVGSTSDAPRPGLIEGVAFSATAHPRSTPISLHRAGDLLFLRSRYAFQARPHGTSLPRV